VAQGRTTDSAHLLVTGSLNRRSLYVGMTRGRQANTAYVATGEPAPGKEPELVRPEVVLAEIIDNDATELTATEAIRQAQEWSASTGHLASIWAAAMRESVKETIDGKLKEHLTASEYQRYLREPQRQPLQRALTERELNGENLSRLIHRITSADLSGARSISAVLHGRLARVEKSQDTSSTWAQRTPRTPLSSPTKPPRRSMTGSPHLACGVRKGPIRGSPASWARSQRTGQPWSSRTTFTGPDPRQPIGKPRVSITRTRRSL
jgi:hypothetical protein